MSDALDHLVLAVHDLDAAARRFEAMGFTVGARNRHPWGTENRLVQFPGMFLELITLGEEARIAPHAPGSFSFGAFIRDWLAAREGLAMVALASQDARADRDRFAALGLGDFAVFDFERQARSAEGEAVRVGFSLAFARLESGSEAGLFVCQHRAPRHFWQPALQRHANGASEIVEVVMIAKDQGATAHLLARLTGRTAVAEDEDEGTLRLRLARGAIAVMNGDALARHTGVTRMAIPSRWVHATIAVPDSATIAARLEAAGFAPRRHGDMVILDPTQGFGASIGFVATP